MPKIVQFHIAPGGNVVELADNNSTALEIEGVDSKDYIVVDTTDGSEILNLSAGGASGQRFQIRPTYVTYAASQSVALMQTGATATSQTFCQMFLTLTPASDGQQPTSSRLLLVVLKGFASPKTTA